MFESFLFKAAEEARHRYYQGPSSSRAKKEDLLFFFESGTLLFFFVKRFFGCHARRGMHTCVFGSVTFKLLSTLQDSSKVESSSRRACLAEREQVEELTLQDAIAPRMRYRTQR